MSTVLGRIDEATVRAAAALAESLGLAELELQDGELRVRVVRSAAPSEETLRMIAAAAVSAQPVSSRSGAASGTAAAPDENPRGPVDAGSALPAAALPAGVVVRAPMAGTFYRAPAPGQPVFVDVGSVVAPDSVLCIIESMKMMNRIEAERPGRVAAVLVSNGARVQVGQPLFTLTD